MEELKEGEEVMMEIKEETTTFMTNEPSSAPVSCN